MKPDSPHLRRFPLDFQAVSAKKESYQIKTYETQLF